MYYDIFYKGSKLQNRIPNDVIVYKQPSFGYSRLPKNKDILLEGFFQSFKYLDIPLIREQFHVPNSIKADIEKSYPIILEKPVLSLHVRRGDYMSLLYRHPFCGKAYYRNALKRFPTDMPVLVCSDDMAWCKRNFIGKRFIFIEGKDAIFDFYIQVMSTHNIISNSSFSLLASLLNQHKEKEVYVPSMWFGFALNNDISDIYPPEFHVIKNRYSIPMLIKALHMYYTNEIKRGK